MAPVVPPTAATLPVTTQLIDDDVMIIEVLDDDVSTMCPLLRRKPLSFAQPTSKAAAKEAAKKVSKPSTKGAVQARTFQDAGKGHPMTAGCCALRVVHHGVFPSKHAGPGPLSRCPTTAMTLPP